MADPTPAERLILKILSGIQSGVEVSLSSGEYSIGSSADDDIQFIDVSLKATHLRLRLQAGKIEMRAQAGSFHSGNGLHEEADSQTWRDVQPLDVITAGTTRFALGLPGAQWATITDDESAASSTTRVPEVQKAASRAWPGGLIPQLRGLALPLAGLAVLLAVTAWSLLSDSVRLTGRDRGNDLELTRTTVEQFPFAKGVSVRQDVDGTIYATGFVESTVERRAVADAIERTGVPARVRLQVLQVLRSELDGLIRSERVSVTYTLSDTGVVVFDGTILNPALADRFVSRVQETIPGLTRVDARLRTAKTLLEDIEKLARSSQITQSVIFRLDRDVIEANGVIAVNRIDSWVGFLQSYSRRYSKDISLRSFVQLQYDASNPAMQQLSATNGQPIVFGPDSRPDERKINEIFAGFATADPSVVLPAGAATSPEPSSSPSASATPATRPAQTALAGIPLSSAPSGAGRSAGPPIQPWPLSQSATAAAAQQSAQVAAGTPGSSTANTAAAAAAAAPNATANTLANPLANPLASPFANPLAIDAASQRGDVRPPSELPAMARDVLRSWLTGEATPLTGALDTLAAEATGAGKRGEAVTDAVRQAYARRFQPLLARAPGERPEMQAACRPGSRLTPAAMPAVLFWLDLMSSTEALNLASFNTVTQGEILEAALDPALVRACLPRSSGGEVLLATSIYLAEAARNPDFVDFVTRSLPAYDLRVSGASMSEMRYVQTPGGDKMTEGAAPDSSSRIDVIGELGMAVQMANGFSRLIYGPGLNWLNRR